MPDHELLAHRAERQICTLVTATAATGQARFRADHASCDWLGHSYSVANGGIEMANTEQRWQYRTLRFENGREFEEAAERSLNELGADGWEVAGFARFEIGRENGYRVILKRPN